MLKRNGNMILVSFCARKTDWLGLFLLSIFSSIYFVNSRLVHSLIVMSLRYIHVGNDRSVSTRLFLYARGYEIVIERFLTK